MGLPDNVARIGPEIQEKYLNKDVQTKVNRLFSMTMYARRVDHELPA